MYSHLPAQVDTDQHADILARLGINPADLGGIAGKLGISPSAPSGHRRPVPGAWACPGLTGQRQTGSARWRAGPLSVRIARPEGVPVRWR